MTCPACHDTRAEYLGALGNLDQYRCRACHMIYSLGKPESPDEWDSAESEALARRHHIPGGELLTDWEARIEGD